MLCLFLFVIAAGALRAQTLPTLVLMRVAGLTHPGIWENTPAAAPPERSVANLHAKAGEDLPVFPLLFFAGNRGVEPGWIHPQQSELIVTCVVVGKYLNAVQARVFLVEDSDGFEMFLRVVDPGQKRTAQKNSGAGSIKEVQVAENKLVAGAGPQQVCLRVCQLVVEKKQVNQRKQRRKRLLAIMAAGIKAGMEVLLARSAEQSAAEIELQGGLSSAQSETAAGHLVINPVAEHDSHHVLDRHLRAKGPILA